MTDPSTPNNPKSRRSKGREPQTIDLTATVVPDEAEAPPAMEQAGEQRAGEPAAEPRAEEQAANAEPATAERKAPGFSGKAAVTGLIFGLIGGVAGAAAMLALQKPAATIPSPALETRIAAIETRMSEPPADSAAPLTPRLGAAEAEIRSISGKIGALQSEQQTLKKAQQAAGGKIDALAEMVQSQSAQPNGQDSVALPEIEQRLGALDSAQTAIRAAQGQLEEGQRALAPLAGKVDALAKQIADTARHSVDPMPAVRYALTTRLDRAVASGRPFADALGALLKTGVTEAETADLAVFAGSGAPTAAQLKAEFRDPSQAIIAEERSQSGESFTDKLTRMSKSVLRIRPSQDALGDDLASMVVRIEAALDRGSFTEAARIWNALPDTARQLSAAFGKRITARARAASALDALDAKAITALDGSVR